MNWKRFGLYLIVLFIVSFGSSVTTWYWLTDQKEKQVSWKDYLSLSTEQEKIFSALESELTLALKDIAVYDAQNKVSLCSYLHSSEIKPEEVKSTAQKMAHNYGIKQEKIAMTLASIAAILTPEQKKRFTSRLMHEVCVSCKNATETDKCLCGMCGHHT